MLSHLLDGHPNINSFPEDISFLYAFYPNPSRWGDFNAQKSRLRSVIEKVTIPMENRLVPNTSCRYKFNAFWSCFDKYLSPESFEKFSLLLDLFILSWTEYTDFDPSLPFVFKETTQLLRFSGLLQSDPDFLAIQLVRDPRDNLAAITAGYKNYYMKMGEDRLEILASVINRIRSI